MDEILKHLNEIELLSSDILTKAKAEKEQLFATYEAESKLWDESLQRDTTQKIESIRQHAEEKSKALLASETARIEKQEQLLKDSYARYHSLYVDKLFDKLVRE